MACLSARIKEPPDNLKEGQHGEAHEDKVYLDPPTPWFRKPPDKLGNVSLVEEVLKIVCEASEPIKVIQFSIEQSLS